MEGLILAGMLETVRAVLPAENLGWAFPDDMTAAVLLQGPGRSPVNLVLNYRPPEPVLYLSNDSLRGEPVTPFQRYLQANARGNLRAARQVKLDRVAVLDFAGASGFRPAPELRLVFELTGRNANLIVLDAESDGDDLDGRAVLAVSREVRSDRNRYREVRARRP
ncbi:MAG TPA: NFACT family protein, partial [Deinococcales bacterium]|nr:NFACT family protein [Deinococcales bacterium]